MKFALIVFSLAMAIISIQIITINLFVIPQMNRANKLLMHYILLSDDPLKDLGDSAEPLYKINPILNDDYFHNAQVTIFKNHGEYYEFKNPINIAISQVQNLILLLLVTMLTGYFFLIRLFNRLYLEPIKFLKELVHKEVYNLSNETLTDPEAETHEMSELIRGVKEVVSELKTRNSVLLSQSREFQKKSFTDGLTGLNNRAALIRLLSEDELWQEPTKPVSFLLLDIDFFKQYNDHYGHLAGDEALKMVASAFKDIFFMPNDFWARYGGEEFAVLLQNTRLRVAIAAAERLRKKIESLHIPHEKNTVSPWLTCSVGVASSISGIYTHTDTLIATADEALYLSKDKGRNRVSALYPPATPDVLEVLSELETL